MNARQKKNDDLTITLTITLDKEDWAEPRKKKLSEFRRTTELKGFRKGMAPMSLIEKLHGPQALVQTINTLVGEKLDSFIKDKKLSLIGEPLPSQKEDKNDWDNPDKFTFSFDMAPSPEVNVALSAEDKIPYYKVATSEEAIADYKKGLLKQFGQLESGEAAGEDDFIIADFVAGEDRKVEGAYVAIRSITDADIKKSFVGLKKDDTKVIDIVKTFTNEADRAAMFKVKKEELSELPAEWTMTVTDVKTFVDAPLTQATFDAIFGEGNCSSEEEFNAKVVERLETEYAQESDYRFMVDAKEYMIEKAAIALPDSFMKRWILEANEGKFTAEDIEKEYDLFAKDFRWSLIRTEIMKQQKLQVSKDDVMKQARNFAQYQYAMYGMNNIPEEFLNQFAEKMIADQQQLQRIVDKVEDDKTLEYIRATVTLDEKNVTLDEMRELTK